MQSGLNAPLLGRERSGEDRRLAPAPLEPRSIVASFEEVTGRIEVRISSQAATNVAAGISAALPGLAQSQVHVLVGDVGGGFGMKAGIHPEDIVAAFAARELKRPVRWQADRSEEFLSASPGRDVTSRAELALDAGGRVLALRVKSFANVGAYAKPISVAIQLLIGPWIATSIYDIRTIDLHLHAVLTHTTPTGAYRGAGRPEAIYIIERLMDAAAREMKLDPAELRRRNMIEPAQMPYKNAMGQIYDSGNFAQLMDQGLELADWEGFAARRRASEARGRLRGRGLATFLEWTGGNAFEEKVSVEVTPDGFIEIFSATQQMGQGIQTSYAQLAVDVFGVSIERIRIVQGDTDRGNGIGSVGSRSLFTGGTAVHVAYSSVNDIGRVVNPAIARGQIEGGAVQGIGQALLEEVVYDAESGQLLTGSFMDYAMPRAEDGVMFRSLFDTSIPCRLNALGVKGVGELGTIGATPATMNAVIDALDHAGLGRVAESIQMPATSERVWLALQSVRFREIHPASSLPA